MISIDKKKIKEQTMVVCNPATKGLGIAKDFIYTRNKVKYKFRILTGGWGYYQSIDGKWVTLVEASKMDHQVFACMRNYAFAKVLHHKLP